MQANAASVMHGRFQRHSPTDIWAAIQTRSICGLNVKCLPHTQVSLGPQPVVLSGRLWKHCNLGVNWLPWPWGKPASNLSPVTCSLHFAPACFCCHAVPARRDGDSWNVTKTHLSFMSSFCLVFCHRRKKNNQYSTLKKSHCWHNAHSLSFCSLADSLIFSL